MSQLLLLNPRKRRRKLTAKQAKYFGKRKRRASPRRARRVSVRVSRPHRSRRRAVITVAANPRRRRSRRRLSINPRRRGYRSNPMPRLNVRGIGGQVQSAAVGAVGATVVDVAMGYVGPMLPAALVGPNVYPVVKGAAAILIGAAAQAVGLGKWAGRMTEGSLTVTLHGVIRSFLPAGVALGYINSGYVPRAGMNGMGAYMKGVRTPLMGVRTPLMGMGANEGGASGYTSQMESENAHYGPGYVAGGMRGMNAYMNN
jgi:hypothetical protein